MVADHREINLSVFIFLTNNSRIHLPPSAFFVALSKIARVSTGGLGITASFVSDDATEIELCVLEVEDESTADALSDRAKTDAAPTIDTRNCLLPTSSSSKVTESSSILVSNVVPLASTIDLDA